MTSRLLNPMMPVLALIVALAAPAAAQETPLEKAANGMTARQIVDRANYVSYYQGADGRADVAMTILDKDNNKQTRSMTILRRDADVKDVNQAEDRKADQAFTGEQKFYVYIREPSSFNKMVFMVHKHLDTEDDRWLYMPALDNVKRIAGKDKRTSFVGSHFLYEDVSGRNVTLDTHELVEESDNYYVIRSTPKDPSLVEFASFKTWILKKDDVFLVVRTAWYDAKGEKIRQYDAIKWDYVGEQKYPTVLQSRMWDAKMGGQTVLQYSNVKHNLGIPDDIFTERYLRRAPVKYLD